MERIFIDHSECGQRKNFDDLSFVVSIIVMKPYQKQGNSFELLDNLNLNTTF